MRYLFITDLTERITSFGAVGHLSYLVSAYLFFFEMSLAIDPSHRLFQFLHLLFAIEVGIILLSAGLYKYALGYISNSGFEYALVNPSWGKLFFLFNRLKPSSSFFKLCNYGAFILEVVTGVLFFIPATQVIGATFLIFLFLAVFITIRVNILPLLMISIGVFYLKLILFHFHTLDWGFNSVSMPGVVISLIKAIFIVYFVLQVTATLLSLLRYWKRIQTPPFLKKFMKWRPFFEWSVFTVGLTRYFISVKKVSKLTKEVKEIFYDGFSQHFRELFHDPALFFRFAHHHEASLHLGIFTPALSSGGNVDPHVDKLMRDMVSYSKTFPSEPDSALVFSVIEIEKKDDRFIYQSKISFLIDGEKVLPHL